MRADEALPQRTLLRLSGAGVRYPGRRTAALDDVDLTVAAGDRVGVTGRTGAGKSTLALLAGGFIPRVVRAATTGSTAIDALDALTADAAVLMGRVGIVFTTPGNQLSASKPSVREELAFGLENLAVPRSDMDTQIDAVLERLGIAHLAEREPLTLSGGEQQRVAIASIVVMGTRVLVLDEPTAHLDPAGTAVVATLLEDLATGGTAVVCAEHDPAVLGRLTRVAVLDAGRIVGTDRPGVALGQAIAGSVGLASPTLVRLAEAAGVDPATAFDPAAIGLIAAGLASMRAGASSTAVALAHGADASTDHDAPPPWAPVGERPTPTIEIDGLVHRYRGGPEAVRGVSLRFAPGEAVAIVGRNGAGKTTLVKHLNGLLRLGGGEVRIDGRSTVGDRIDVLAATVGFVFSDPADQLFERSVEREVAFGPRNLGVDTERTRALVTRSLEAVGLSGERASHPYDLDLPRRKLVALASVLAMDPAILVLDEPTSGQDPEGAARVSAVVRAWRDAGRTAIAITHDMEFAARAFDRVIVMRDGEVIADGPPATVLSAANADLLASTGLEPPPAARVAAALGLGGTAGDAETLLAALRARG